MISLGEFDLLRDARQDLRKLTWAHPSRREATRLYHNVKRAKEEITRCNVEVRRLLTYMYDEHIDYYHAVSRNLFVNPPLARELSRQWTERDQLNRAIVGCLRQIAQLPNFTGSLESGQRFGRNADLGVGVPLPSWAAHTSCGDDESTVGHDDEALEGQHGSSTDEDGMSVQDRDGGGNEGVGQVEDFFEFLDRAD